MISFKNIGVTGGLGDALFQYAFLRTQAEKLRVTFYCPIWIGDKIFDLNDKRFRAAVPKNIINHFTEKHRKNYNRNDLVVPDSSDMHGFFLSEKNFNNSSARKYFSFSKNKLVDLKEKYKNIDFSNSTAVHINFDKNQSNNGTLGYFYMPNRKYYEKALNTLGVSNNVMIISDNENNAKEYFKKLDISCKYTITNVEWEQLYLITLCRNIICEPSTLSWWGAWLNKNSNKKIVFPKEGINRPLGPFPNKDFLPEKWITISALNLVVGNHVVVRFPSYAINLLKNISLVKMKTMKKRMRLHFVKNKFDKKYWSKHYKTNQEAYQIELKKHEEIVKNCKLGVVEIGILNGETTKVLAKANQSIPIYGIDPLIPDSMNENLFGTEEALAENMRGLDNFHFFKDYSYNIIKNWDKPFDYLFIDGSHVYEDVKQDFEDWFPKLSKGGLVSFHDSTMNRGGQDHWDGPSKCADEFISDSRLEYVRSVGRLTIFRKK